MPQIGCSCNNCAATRHGTSPQQYAVSLGLIDQGSSWIIDPTPDVKYQYDILTSAAPDAKLAGILLTHLHMGHYTGLLQFGKEALNIQGLPLYATDSACNFLSSNQPWKQLIADGNIVLHTITPTQPLKLSQGLTVTPALVPHRGEYSDTVAYYVQGPSKQLFYCPDIDSWSAWQADVRDVVQSVDLAFLDACFYSGAELPGRDMSKVPHPLVTDTLQRLQGLEQRFVLIHMNHTNPLHGDTPERVALLKAGVQIGRQGQQYSLD